MRFMQSNGNDAGPTNSSASHAQKFPLCGRYLMLWLNPDTLKKRVPKRWEIFVKWCGSETRAIEACTWQKGPMVQINSQAVGRRNGRYRGGDTVFVHGKVADKYESGDGWLIWESTVLHELIHWARHQDHLKDGNLEVGQEFEKEAYGQAIELTTPWRAGP